jgi:N-acyl homoserine lactone hydrolase
MMTSSSAPQKLYLLQLMTTTIQVPSGPLDMVLGCYLVETGDGKRILIDSGYPPDLPPPPEAAAAENVITVIEQLRSLGLRPDDIDLLICTHFDVDHVGYHDAFTKAELVVQRAHYELARSGHARFASARAHWDHPSLRYRLVDGDVELLPGLTLLETSGHTAAHQSVLVRLSRTGPVLLAIDAVMFERLFTPERPVSPADENGEQLRASTRKLLDLVEREHLALVVFGHDGQQWRTLRKAPEFYD